MLATEYASISKELQELSKTIPLYWGAVQNDNTDAKLNLFNIKSKQQLETKIADFNKKDKNYFRRRWFLWQCAKVDEFLFYHQVLSEVMTYFPANHDLIQISYLFKL